MSFPIVRLRRLRKSPQMRDFVAETQLNISQFVYPVFITDQNRAHIPVESMPGIYQNSIDNALIEIGQALELGVKSILVFGIPEGKDQEATSAWDEYGVVQRAIREIKRQFGQDIIVIADTCLCEYMSHGHCGIIMEGKVLNDPTLEILARVAISQAEAGADIIAPSDMMDGRIGIIRDALDEAGLDETTLMSYSVKFASSLYAPFRDAAQSAPSFGDRKTYQMDPRNRRESLIEVQQDLAEGADMIMIKPAMGYLDLVRDIRQMVEVPIAAYSVSGEYSMIKAAAQQGWIDERAVVLEMLTGIKRAGADILITYHALQAAQWLKELEGR